MALKDHYRILRILPKASQEEIKKAYRNLAFQFHPDKNSSPSAIVIFREVQEAYSILSDKGRKKLYDEERYFSGLSSRKEPAAISADWIRKLSKELNMHMAHIHSTDINHRALHDYINLILSEEHLAVLQEENNTIANEEIIKDIWHAIRKIDVVYLTELRQKLALLASQNYSLQKFLEQSIDQRLKQSKQEKWLPYIVLLIVTLLCFFMYFYSKK